MMKQWLVVLCILIIYLDMVKAIDSTYKDRNIAALDIINNIAKGQDVNYDSYTITGDWNLAKLKSREIYSEINITNSIIEEPINFYAGENTTFLEEIDFTGTRFKKMVVFSKLNFTRKIKFTKAQFDEAVEFRHTQFNCAPDFPEAQFKNYGMFDDSYFAGSAGFDNVHFFGLASFNSAIFGKEAFFNNVEFDTIADFQGSIFQNKAFFDEDRFSTKAYFDNAKFGGLASFYNSRFTDYASFRGAKFDDNINLKNSQIATIEFKNISSTDKTTINLTNSSFSRFLAHWKVIKNLIPKEGDQGPVYIALIKNYKDLQWSKDANDCYIDYREWDRTESRIALNDKGINTFFDNLDYIFNGYGIKPKYPIFWSVIFIFLFAILFSLGKTFREKIEVSNPHILYRYGTRGAPKKGLILRLKGWTSKIINRMRSPNVSRKSFMSIFRRIPCALIFSLTAFIPGFSYFTDIFVSLEPIGTASKLAFVFERIIGAFFISLIIAAITRVYITGYAI
jgi:hypothetical protein